MQFLSLNKALNSAEQASNRFEKNKFESFASEFPLTV